MEQIKRTGMDYTSKTYPGCDKEEGKKIALRHDMPDAKGKHADGFLEIIRLVCEFGRNNRRRVRGLSEAIQNSSDCFRRVYRAKNPHAPLTAGAFQNVHRKNAFHQFVPGIIPRVNSRLFNGAPLFFRTVRMCRQPLIRRRRKDSSPPGSG